MPDPDDNGDKDAIIQRLQREARTAAARQRDAEAKVSELEKQLETATSDHDKALAAAETRGEEKAKAALVKDHQKALAAAEVRARAARKLADPDDAAKFLDVDELLDKEGKTTAEGIDKALDELVEKKPYLASTSSGAGNSHRPSGNGDGGARTPAPGTNEQRFNDALRAAVKH